MVDNNIQKSISFLLDQDVDNVNKYLVNSTILECSSNYELNNNLFVDKNFINNIKSVISEDNNQCENIICRKLLNSFNLSNIKELKNELNKLITFNRLSSFKEYNKLNILKNCLNNNYNIKNDIIQGTITNQHFLNALYILAEDPNRIATIIEHNIIEKKGFFIVKVFIHGVAKSIIIDDFFPCYKKSIDMFIELNLQPSIDCLYFMGVNKQTFNIWPIILEKVWAKVNKNYLESFDKSILEVLYLFYPPYQILSNNINYKLLISFLNKTKISFQIFITACNKNINNNNIDKNSYNNVLFDNVYTIDNALNKNISENSIKLRNIDLKYNNIIDFEFDSNICFIDKVLIYSLDKNLHYNTKIFNKELFNLEYKTFDNNNLKNNQLLSIPDIILFEVKDEDLKYNLLDLNINTKESSSIINKSIGNNNTLQGSILLNLKKIKLNLTNKYNNNCEYPIVYFSLYLLENEFLSSLQEENFNNAINILLDKKYKFKLIDSSFGSLEKHYLILNNTIEFVQGTYLVIIEHVSYDIFYNFNYNYKELLISNKQNITIQKQACLDYNVSIISNLIYKESNVFNISEKLFKENNYYDIEKIKTLIKTLEQNYIEYKNSKILENKYNVFNKDNNEIEFKLIFYKSLYTSETNCNTSYNIICYNCRYFDYLYIKNTENTTIIEYYEIEGLNYFKIELEIINNSVNLDDNIHNQYKSNPNFSYNDLILYMKNNNLNKHNIKLIEFYSYNYVINKYEEIEDVYNFKFDNNKKYIVKITVNAFSTFVLKFKKNYAEGNLYIDKLYTKSYYPEYLILFSNNFFDYCNYFKNKIKVYNYTLDIIKEEKRFNICNNINNINTIHTIKYSYIDKPVLFVPSFEGNIAKNKSFILKLTIKISNIENNNIKFILYEKLQNDSYNIKTKELLNNYNDLDLNNNFSNNLSSLSINNNNNINDKIDFINYEFYIKHNSVGILIIESKDIDKSNIDKLKNNKINYSYTIEEESYEFIEDV